MNLCHCTYHFCQNKVVWPSFFFTPRYYSLLNKHPHDIRHASTIFFKTALKPKLFCQQNTQFFIPGQRIGVLILLHVWVCLCLSRGEITKGLCIDHVWLSFWGVYSSYCLWSVSCHCEVLRAHLKLRHLISVQYYYLMRYAYISFEFALTAVALDIVIVVYMKGRVGLRGGRGVDVC